MRTLLMAALFLAGASASADYVVEGRIGFQEGSKWVKASSLCVNGDEFVHSDAQPRESCGENSQGDKVNCYTFPADFTQPMVSTRAICDRFEGEGQGGSCLEWITVDYIQTARVKNVVYRSYSAKEDGSAPIAYYYTTIPECEGADRIDAN